MNWSFEPVNVQFQKRSDLLVSSRLLRQFLFKHPSQTSSEEAFTLTEILVVVIIVAVLFGIAAPGWLGFMNRQRVNGAKTEVLQVMRETQQLAITRRRVYNLELSATAPEVSIFLGDGTNNVTPLKTYQLGKQDGSEADVELATLPAAAGKIVVFEFDGSVRDFGTPNNSDESIYKVVVSPENDPNPRSCVVIDTLLGSMSEGRGGDCDA